MTLEQWKHCNEHMESLLKIKAPEALIAQYYVSVILPKIIRHIGVHAYSLEMAKNIARDNCLSMRICTYCMKARAIEGDTTCLPCTIELADFINEVEGNPYE